MQTEQKSELSKAYDRLRALNLETNADQFIELNNILFDLATKEYKKGLDEGFEISKNV
mgnify:FL=1